jgi:hypothetical protein
MSTIAARVVALVGTFVVASALAGCQVSLAPSCDVASKVEADGPQAGSHGGSPRAEEGPVACPGPRGSGSTTCGFESCGPGQSCDQSGLPECRPGCSSDEHCARTDRCVRAPGESEGRCESCGGIELGDAAPGCIDPARTGVTECFHHCGPGTYCSDVGIPECVVGCVTDANCGPSERCDRPGRSKVGTCTSCYAVSL